MAASNSILKLQVDDKQYEASLKSAQSGIQALMGALRQSGKTFNDVDKQTEQYVRELGKMEAKATTTRGRIGEMSSAFIELSQVEKQLTNQERQSPVGKALTESLEQLKTRINETKKDLADVTAELNGTGKASGGGLFGGSKLDGMLQVFGGNLMTKGAGMLAGLASEMTDMVKQGVELAKQGEGIRIAFERLGRGDILDGLRQATHGTVTDIELMKAAVKFNDFKLPLEELGTMLAFAQQKAKDTGQSVDYMVDSIVTGLGRKSLMILDNLGLSATEVKDKMKETGDMTKAVGAIIREQMAKAGDYVETAADRAAQANVSLQNKMEELGRKFAPVEEASSQLWTSMKIGILDIVGGPLARLLNGLTEAGRLKNMLDDLNGGGNGKESQTEKALRLLREYSGGGRGIEGKRDLYNRQVASYSKQEENAWRDVNRLREELKGLRRQQQENGLAGNLQPLIDDTTRQLVAVENRAKAIQIMRANYQKGASSILNPEIPSQSISNNSGKKSTKQDIDFANDSIMAQEKLVQDLTQKWKTSSEELRDGYLEQLNAAQKKLEEMKSPPDVDSIIAKQYPDMSEQNYKTGYSGSAQSRSQSLLSDYGQTIESYFNAPIGTESIRKFVGEVKSIMADTDLGSELYNNLSAKISDATIVSDLISQSLSAGVSAADIAGIAQAMQQKLFSPDGLTGEDIAAWLEAINQLIEENGGLKLNINPETGKVEREESDAEKMKALSDSMLKTSGNISTLTSGIKQLTGGLRDLGIDIPECIEDAIGVIDAVSKIINGVGTIIGLFATSAMTANTVALEVNTAALLAASVIPFSNGGIVPSFAKGGIIHAAGGWVGGHSFSGDRVHAMVNSGELILNSVQQDTLATILSNGAMQDLYLSTDVSAEDIIFILNNNGNRRGLGNFIND